MFGADRYWWAELLGALALAAAGVLFPFHEAQIFLTDVMPGEQNTLWESLGLCALLALMSIACSCYLGIRSAQDRSRMQRRRAALRGDLNAVPLADAQINPDQAPDVAQAPLVLLWRASGETRFMHGVIFFFAVVGIVIAVAGIVVIVSSIVRVALTLYQRPPYAIAIAPFAESLALMGVGVGIEIVVIRFAFAGLPLVLGKPFGITAGPEGISYRSRYGTRRQVPWHEMRLLEVASWSLAVSYRIYDGHGYIEWADYPMSDCVPAGITLAEMARRKRSLLELINARTGLVPRTFDRKLT